MKPTRYTREIRKTGWAVMLIMLFAVRDVSSQTFDILNAKPSDRVARSRLFMVDSNNVINTFASFSLDSPVDRITGDTLIVDMVQSTLAAGKEEKAVSEEFSLDQNFPNPFNPSTTIRFHVRKTSKVSLVLFDAVGREVCTLVDDTRAPGSYEIQWTGKDKGGLAVSSGVYFYRMIAQGVNSVVSTRKMNLLK